ncbi:hypothetical protein OEIGOIKO_00076 [Streptomyces chrestomyceticus JCM 4735]|uniref:Uncharacterized protein n=1 Tax=Streptomyces chrestomyceticus JCM 4735 TaxID=1306181 RepID=A0A7U9PXP3_9ACTN|nr:hypothetical protein OEIGOIKO_00076 [Streptomyces chrestomyceticus JCM 4735]
MRIDGSEAGSARRRSDVSSGRCRTPCDAPAEQVAPAARRRDDPPDTAGSSSGSATISTGTPGSRPTSPGTAQQDGPRRPPPSPLGPPPRYPEEESPRHEPHPSRLGDAQPVTTSRTPKSATEPKFCARAHYSRIKPPAATSPSRGRTRPRSPAHDGRPPYPLPRHAVHVPLRTAQHYPAGVRTTPARRRRTARVPSSARPPRRPPAAWRRRCPAARRDPLMRRRQQMMPDTRPGACPLPDDASGWNPGRAGGITDEQRAVRR